MKNTLHFLLILVLVCSQSYGQNPIIVENQKLTIENIGSSIYELKNKGELRVSSSATTISGVVNLASDSAWLILDGVIPSATIASHLKYIQVNGQPAVNKVNVRITNYLQGSVIQAHVPNFEALTIYKDINYQGDEMKCIPYKYYKSTDLANFDNEVSSFKLKKGYMATFAQNENGTGYSKVYIADNEDIEISTLPVGLNNFVSFVRVFPWRYTDKKGFGSGLPDFNRSNIPVKLTKSGWFYNWGTISTEDLTDVEFVPTRWNAKSLTDSRWKEILDNNYSSHLLGFNEPDGDEQANMTLNEMLLYWPKMLESGLRLGSPAMASDQNLLYNFIDKCDELNYRVDFVAMHDYGEGTTEAFYNKCKTIHDKTGRPIWIKEFNWGGTWTRKTPTYPDISKRISEIMDRYNSEGFIERYSIFSFDEIVNKFGGVQNRAIFYTPAMPNYTITPLGVAYRDKTAPMAFNSAKQINKSIKLVAPQNIKISNQNGVTNILKWDDLNVDLGTVFIERSFGTTTYTTIAQVAYGTKSFNDDVTALGSGIYNYRLSTRHSGFTNSPSIIVTYDLNLNTIFNVALNKPVIATSVHSALYPATNAVDGNNKAENATRWVTKAGDLPASIEIDLKGTFAISELKFYTGNAAYNAPVTSFVFQYWNGTNWIDIITETQNTSATFSKTFNEVSTDKVRLIINETSDGIARFFEIEVYGRIASLGNHDFNLNKFNIFPNPATDFINISGDISVSSIAIYDINSKVVLTQKESNIIDVSTLTPGVYFVKINNSETYKFVRK